MDPVSASVLRLPRNSRVQATGTAKELYVMDAGSKKLLVGTNSKRTKLFNAVSVSLFEAQAPSFDPRFCDAGRRPDNQVMSRLPGPAREVQVPRIALLQLLLLRKVSLSSARLRRLN